MKTINGDLIKFALKGDFDVVVHGCNCFCTMGSGLAPQMAKAFGCDRFPMEAEKYKGWINKLGNIDFKPFDTKTGETVWANVSRSQDVFEKGGDLVVVNAYTQYRYGKNHLDGDDRPVEYAAIELCFKKMNHIFKGKHIGLPWIGCGLAGGDREVVKRLVEENLKDCEVTVVNYDPGYRYGI